MISNNLQNLPTVFQDEPFENVAVSAPLSQDSLALEQSMSMNERNTLPGSSSTPMLSVNENKSTIIDQRFLTETSAAGHRQEASESAEGTSGMPVEIDNVTLSGFNFYYMYRAYGEKIRAIEHDTGVEIHAQVSISFRPKVPTEKHENFVKAKERFCNLCQSSIPVLSSRTIPYSDHIMERFNAMPNTSKFVLMLSAEGYQLIGPESDLDQFVQGLTVVGPAREQNFKLIDFVCEDSELSKDVEMYKVHWDFVKCLFGKQLQSLKTKFRVNVDEQTNSESSSSVKITITSCNVNFILQSHACQGLLDLYQKVASNLMQRSIKDPKDMEEAKRVFQEIRSSHPYVKDYQEKNQWILVGFIKHLYWTVKEIEKKIGRKIFQDIKLSPVSSASGQACEEKGYEEVCPICLDNFMKKVTLSCKHEFCEDCWKKVKQDNPVCPICKAVHGKITGDQPDGRMTSRTISTSLPGFGCNTIEINYDIPHGIQTEKHPNPGKPFSGAHRTAYLPNTIEGKEVLKLLKRAFDQRLIFTIGTSRTTGAENMVTWNDIHHKTRMDGGQSGYGYPDPEYLQRVRSELKAFGIE
uniref:E3 ubiquitin-protein ligase n=1 Tax=Erpetoichthys calabaricus TaxID=27687 RepID=A0A8C4SV12_ERPCA